ncbi:MAG: CRTAC1 family protein [Planctomycetota bacterium]
MLLLGSLAVAAVGGAQPRAATLPALGSAAPSLLSEGGDVPPPLRFVAETPTEFVHDKGGTGRRYLPETMGAGLALLDYDGDGDLDLYVVQGGPIAPSAEVSASPRPGNRLFANDGHGRYTEVPGAAGAADPGYGMGCAVADIDHDGDPDLYVTNFGADVLYRNDGGSFVDVTVEAGLGDDGWGASAAFADFDRDGHVDLYVTRYLTFTLETHRECTLGKKIPAYCSPDAYPGAADRLYRNLGNGRFEDVTEEAGLAEHRGKGLGVVCADFDRDGRVDVYVANDGVANQILFNRVSTTPSAGATPKGADPDAATPPSRPKWRFVDDTLVAGVGYNDDGMAQAGMGIAIGDLDGDRQTDLFVTNLSGETNVFYRAIDSGFFEDATAVSRLGPPSFLLTGFGADAADFDADGDLDLFVINGHVIDNIAEFNDHQSYGQPDQLFLNNGTGRFAVAPLAIEGMQLGVGRGSVVGDVDGDGDLDVVVSQCEGPMVLYRNQGATGRHLRLRLEGRRSNRDAIGARVDATFGGRTVTRVVYGGGSYLSASPYDLHLGVGPATEIEALVVTWPSGATQRLESVPTFGAGEAGVRTVTEPGGKR